MEKAGQSWTVPVAVEDIPDTGLHMEIDVPAEIREAMAKLAGLRELPELSAVFDLVRAGGSVHVSGRVKARVGQTCVVSLEPIENEIDEPIDVEFRPGAETAAAAYDLHTLDEGEEPPEPLVDAKVDLGALASEILLLSLDPYPRKPGAEFAPVKDAETGDRPFAGLAALKNRLGGDRS